MSRRNYFFVFILALSTSAHTQDARLSDVTEYQIKAAFLFNFAKFVEWPPEAFADSTQPIVIGVYGKDPFGFDLDRTILDKKVKGRRILAERLQRLGDLEHCHILFISSSEEPRMADILAKVRDSHVLTVGENPSFTDKGGIINLVNRGNKVRFQINLIAAHRARVRISSRLLRLAEIVKDRYTNGHE